MRVALLVCAGAIALTLLVACADGASDSTGDDAADAGWLDATTVTLPTKPARSKDAGKDADEADDDDDSSEPKDAGIDAAPPAPKYRYRVFVTKERFTGNLGGLAGADEKCAQAAAAANLDGGKTWKAWVSTSQENAIARIVDRSPWYLVNRGTLVFKDFANLTAEPLHPITRNETGSIQVFGLGPTAHRVWTGTRNDGTLTAGKNCSDWTDDTVNKHGVAGANVETPTTSIAASWTRYAIQPEEGCRKKWPIYCFEQ